MESKTKNIKQEFTIRIGPLLKDLIDKQKELINEHTYGCVNGSDWEAGEIIAKKMEDKL